MKRIIHKSDIETAVNAHPLSMANAAKYLNLPFGTFKYHAKKYGLYEPNQSHKGRKISTKGKPYNLQDIISGRCSYKGSGQVIKRRLIDAGLKKDVCEECGLLPTWNDKILTLQLDHIDGNHFNWKLENLQILCPNCHTQTSTHGIRNYGRYGYKRITDFSVNKLQEVLKKSETITEAAVTLGLNHKSSSVRAILKQINGDVA